MPSKFDEYLNDLPDKDKEALAKVNAKDTTDIAPPTPVPAKEIDTTAPKLDEKTAEHIQNVNDGKGNAVQKDSLSNFPEKEEGEQEPQQEQDKER